MTKDARTARTRAIFGAPRALIGMIHVGALPGTPAAREPLAALVDRAVAEARLFAQAGYDALMVENMHDRPYLKGAVGPEIVACMAAVAREVRRACDLPLGVQILAGANREALAVALAAGARFVRVEGFVFAHVADEGLIEAGAPELLRYRRALGAGAEDVAIFADIKKKHSAHAITADVSLVETAHAAEFFLADGLIVTGTATGAATSPAEVEAVAEAAALPVLVGSGATPENVGRYAAADGVIVGSYVKHDGRWENPVDSARARAFAEAFRANPR